MTQASRGFSAAAQLLLKPCPHCHRQTATVADSRRCRRQIVAEIGDCSRQCGQALTHSATKLLLLLFTWETCAFRCWWSHSGSTSTTALRWTALVDSAAEPAAEATTSVDSRQVRALTDQPGAVTGRRKVAILADRLRLRTPTASRDDLRPALTTP